MNKKLILLSLLFVFYHFSCSRDDGGSYEETYYSIEEIDLHALKYEDTVSTGDTLYNHEFQLGMNVIMSYMLAQVHLKGGCGVYAEDTPPMVSGTKGLKDSLVHISISNAYAVADTLPAGAELSHLFSWRYYSGQDLQSMDKLIEALNESAPHEGGPSDIQLVPSFDPDGVREFRYSLRLSFASGKILNAESVRFFLK